MLPSLRHISCGKRLNRLKLPTSDDKKKKIGYLTLMLKAANLELVDGEDLIIMSYGRMRILNRK